MPSFRDVLTAVADAYRSRRDDVSQSAGQLRAFLQQPPPLTGQEQPDRLSPAILEQAERAFAASFDATYGGFGRAPKFPQPMGLEALLRAWLRSRNPHTLRMVQTTLDKMAQGGMYDQLGGGFHRYSVDAQWLVPHFEKMLYDNALLARTYLHAHLATGNAFYRRICEETLDYVLREMTSSEGGFSSTQDADSEGEEGKFFLWTPAEVVALLGEDDGRLFCAYFDVTERGNFEGRNILHTPRYPDVVAHVAGVSETRLREATERGRRVLFEARERRVKPGRDDKTLTAWNGLMLRAFAEAAAALDRDDYRRAAVKNAEFVLSRLCSQPPSAQADAPQTPRSLPSSPLSTRVERGPGGGVLQPLTSSLSGAGPGGGASWRLLRTYKDGQAKLNAYLEDYAFYAAGLLALYEATFDLRWFEAARHLVETMVALFADDAGGGFFDTSADHEALLTRPKDLYDNATPSGNSVAAEVLLRMAELTGESFGLGGAIPEDAGAPVDSPAGGPEMPVAAPRGYRQRAQRLLAGLRDAMAQHPSAFGHLLCALDLSLGPVKEVALVGDPAAADTRALARAVFACFQPSKVVALRPPGPAGERAARLIPFLADRPQLDGKATAYVCQHFTCQLPVTDPAALAEQLGEPLGGEPRATRRG